jgi:serine/threonine protein kinase/tetratricopeptide (TPR) repeat protein
MHPGSRIAHFEIVALIGAGGMGEVYRARDTRLGRDVAIKVLPAEFASDPDRLRRFEQEARAVAALSHPNILALYDVGTHEGAPYLVTELLEGESLRERLGSGAVPVRKAVELGVQIAQGLAAAHEKGIIHRDLKPGNVFVTRDGHVKILDFGIAKLETLRTAQEPAKATTVVEATEAGTTLGSVGYMSPEQVRGQAVDHRTDIFSFGCVLYELLAGRSPFRRDTAPDTTSAILHDEPAALPTGVPGPLGKIVNGCLEKQLEDRFSSAHDLALALLALEGGFFREKPADRSGSAARFVETLTAPRETVVSEETSIVVLPFASMSADPDNEYFADGVTEDIINALTELEQLRVVSRTSAFAYKHKDLDVRKLGEELNVDLVMEGSVRRAGSRLRITAQLITVADGCHLWSERYDREMTDVFAIQDEIARAVVEALKIKLAVRADAPLVKPHTDNLDAYTLYLKGRYFLGQRGESLTRALDCFTKAVEQDASYGLAHAGIADAYSLLAWYGFMAPADAMPRAKAAAMTALGIDDTLPEAHASLAYVRMHFDWDWAGAEDAFRRAMALSRNQATTRQWFSEYLTAVGRVEDALREAQKAQVLEPLNLIVTTRLGDAWYCVHHYDRAVHECRKAVEMDPAFVPAHLWLGLSQLSKGDRDEAVRTLERARSLPGAGPSLMLAALGLAYGVCGRTEAAELVLSELLALASGRHVSALHIALVYLGLGQTDQVFDWLHKACDERATLLVRVKADPLFDRIRTDPRFKDLLSRMNFPASTNP